VCPFCSLLCDDVELRAAPDQSFTLTRHGCRRAAADYARAPLPATAFIRGAPAPLAAALDAAAALLRRARRPLFAGLATDVDGMRAAIDLAERCKATLDHVHGETITAMSRLLQSRGWYGATLSEVRNRADFILVVGVDLNERYESFVRRCLAPADALLPERLAARGVAFLGAAPPPATAGAVDHLACRAGELAPALQGLLALVNGQRLEARRVAGLPIARLRALAERLRGSRYSAIVFAPGMLQVPREPAIAAIYELVDALNRTGRAAMLPLAGDDGGQAALATCGWLTGYPLRVTCGETVTYAPLVNGTAALLAAGTPDALLWIDAFGRHAAPPPAAPAGATVILAAQRPEAAAAAAVFIPVGTPGVDHPARLVRTDTVVSLALPAQRETALPAVATVLRDLLSRL
jgi:formylmethanofuran dehydrogenase subunit B